jgi:hypothetical protein
VVDDRSSFVGQAGPGLCPQKQPPEPTPSKALDRPIASNQLEPDMVQAQGDRDELTAEGQKIAGTRQVTVGAV